MSEPYRVFVYFSDLPRLQLTRTIACVRGYEGPVIKFVDISGVQTMAELGQGESPVCSLPVEGGDDGDDGDDDSG